MAAIAKAGGPPDQGKVKAVMIKCGLVPALPQKKNGTLNPQQQQYIPRVMEIGKKYGLEILPIPAGCNHAKFFQAMS